jgi:hypothetical protein
MGGGADQEPVVPEFHLVKEIEKLHLNPHPLPCVVSGGLHRVSMKILPYQGGSSPQGLTLGFCKDEMHGVRCGDMLGKLITKLKEVNAIIKMLARPKHHWRNWDMHFVNKPLP